MPIMLRGKCVSFKQAVKMIRRQRRWKKARAQAYVAKVEKFQRGSRRVQRACGR